MMRRTYINLRVFALANSNSEAEGIGNKIAHTLRTIGKTSVYGIKHYWKIPEYYELSIDLNLPMYTDASVQAVIELLGSGWNEAGASCFIWDWSDDRHFVDERVRWASVEFIESS